MNSALAELAQEPIEADPLDASFAAGGEDEDELPVLLEDETVLAVYRIYPQVRADMLNAHPWTWLEEQRQLAAAGDPERRTLAAARSPGQEPIAGPGHDRDATDEDGFVLSDAERARFPYRYRWLKPHPEIGVIRAVYQGDSSRSGRPQVDGWRPEGRFVYTDFTPVTLVYQSVVAEETWPQMFVNAMVLALAARLALPITYDLDTKRTVSADAARALSNAQRVDSQSHPPEVITDFGFVQAHLTGFGGNYHRV